MPLVTLGTSIVLLAAGSPAPIASDVAMFERIPLGSNLELYTVGVLDDTRCPDRELCFREERLVVAAALIDGRLRRGVALELGVPVRIAGGTLTLVSTSAKPRLNGAIPLSEYGLSYEFQPD